VDASESAIDNVVHNAALNSVSERVRAIRGKAIDVLKAMIAEEEEFDVVVLDPPAFIKKRKDQKSGEAAYRHLNELAIRLLGKDGILVSASCSRPLSNDVLMDIVRGSARHLDRNAQMIYLGGQGPDHPVHPAIPETNYIKAQFYRVFMD
jgi:23S rRNA (cytosine1962-C5)-methyltransferase